MDYKRHYDKLIESRRNRVLPPGTYVEKHHIVMRSMGGSDESDNLVRLTAREHFIAHRLLWLTYRNRETARAFFLMCRRNKTWNSKFYEELKSQLVCKEETKIKISEKAKGRPHPHKGWKGPRPRLFLPLTEVYNLFFVDKKHPDEISKLYNVNRKTIQNILRKYDTEVYKKVSREIKGTASRAGSRSN